jgi:hypothetical protein
MLVAEEDLPGCRLAIHVTQTTPTSWSLDLLVEPPVQGDVVISFGDMVFRAALSGGNSARIADIPAELLMNRAGPDMLIIIERGAADGPGA